jgi:predicted enzyme related to lactoylglutathione lyase
VGNPVVHFEIGAADDGPLAEFYGKLFSWGLRPYSGGGYTTIDTRGGGGINGGIGRSQTGEPWSSFYVETEDLRATLDRANELGGTTVMPVTNLGPVSIAMFGDPDGLLIGLVQAAAEGPSAIGSAASDGPGEQVSWFEIMGSDAAQTQRFYRDLFGWTITTSGDVAGYGTVDTGSSRGIQGGAGGGEQARWAIVYARVASVDDALRQVEQLGGTRATDEGLNALKAAARAALYGAGAGGITMGEFRDPAGNAFGVYHYG